MRLPSILAAAAALTACNHDLPNSATTASGAGQAVTVVNGDFEQGSGEDIPGWQQIQHAGEKSYDMRIDSAGAHQGHGSFHITRIHDQVYGTLSQDIDASHLAGKTIELSAMLKSRDVGARGYKLMLNGNFPNTLQYSPALTGTNDWQRQSVKLKVPAQVRTLTVGVTLLDAGEAWMDDVELKVVD